MQIWYVNHYAGAPGISTGERAFQLARSWSDEDVRCDVIMSQYHHLMLPDATPDAHVVIEGVPYHFLPARRYEGNGPGRLLNMVDFCRGLSRLSAETSGPLAKPDVIIYSSPHPYGIYHARKIAEHHRAKLVFEIRDLWPLSLNELLGMSRFHPLSVVTGYAERYALRHCDLVASLLGNVEEYLVELELPQKPCVIVPNGMTELTALDHELESDAGRQAARHLEMWRQANKTTFVYAGALGPPNGVMRFLSAAKQVAERDPGRNLAFAVFGGGPLVGEIKQAVDQFGANFAFFGRVSKRDLRQLLRLCDVGYAGLIDKPAVFKYGISPNKILDYYAEGLPVLLPITPCGDPVSQSGGGLAQSILDDEGMMQAITKMADHSKDELAELGRRGRAYVEANHTYGAIARKYLDAIEAVV